MDEPAYWFDQSLLNVIPKEIQKPLQEMLISYGCKVKLENQESSKSYENTISLLNKKLQEQNQKYYELEMATLQLKTRKKLNTENSLHLKAKPTTISQKMTLLKKKNNVLTDKNKELNTKNENLNNQIEFILQNKETDSQELCLMASTYLNELNEMKAKKQECDSVAFLKTELELLRSNEKLYQSHVYEKTKEIFDLKNSFDLKECEVVLLTQYKNKYENMQQEYIRLCAIIGELRIKNLEFKNLIKKHLNKQDTNDDITFLKETVERLINTINYNGGIQKDVIDSTELNKLQQGVSTCYSLLNDVIDIQTQLKQVFTHLICTTESKEHEINSFKELIQKYDKILHNQEHEINSFKELIQKYDKISHNQQGDINDSNTIIFKSNQISSIEEDKRKELINSEIDMLKMENEMLNATMKNIRIETDVINENEALLNENKLLNTQFDLIKSENESLRLYNEDFTNKIQIIKKECNNQISDIKKRTLELENENKILNADILNQNQKIKELNMKIDSEKKQFDQHYKEDRKTEKQEEYIKDMEHEIELYRRDIHEIESKFTEYKKIHDSFNFEAINKNIETMKINIERKDTLISSLYTLLNKYREMKGILINE